MVSFFILFPIAGVAYLLLAADLLDRFLRRAHAPDLKDMARPPVTVLKPLCGAEPNLAANLRSFLDQDYASVQFIFGIQDPADPALEVIRSLAAEYPECLIDIVVLLEQHGANGKISNVINMGRRIRHDLIVLADSDMRAEPDYLSRLVAELAAPGVGAVTCLYRGRPVGGLPSTLAAMFINHHFLPLALVARRLGNDQGCFGATIALNRATLTAIGGFESLKDVLADDYEIGRRVRGLGLVVALSSNLVTDTTYEPDWGALISHELRWARTIRLANPIGFAASLITLPVPISLLILLFSGINFSSMAGLALALLARIWFQRRFEPAPIWLILLRDCLTFAIVGVSFLGRRVRWRNAAFRTAPDGTIARD